MSVEKCDIRLTTWIFELRGCLGNVYTAYLGNILYSRMRSKSTSSARRQQRCVRYTRFKREAVRIGLRINATKTKYTRLPKVIGPNWETVYKLTFWDGNYFGLRHQQTNPETHCTEKSCIFWPSAEIQKIYRSNIDSPGGSSIDMRIGTSTGTGTFERTM